MDAQALEQVAKASADATTNYLSNPTDRAAKLKALIEARRLVAEIEDGDDAFFDRIERITAAFALRFILSTGAVDKIPPTGSISAEDLATSVSAEKTIIVRMMRLLCATGTFDEVKQDHYAHTKRSLNLLDLGYRYFYEVMIDDFVSVFAKFPEYFKTHPLASPVSTTMTPYAWSFGMEGSDWISVIARTPDNLKKFGIGLSGKWAAIPAIGIYPFGEELEALAEKAASENRPFMVDVGGSLGVTMKQILEAYPQLKGTYVVQDLPHVINNIPADFYPPSSGISAMVHDFWTPQPIKNAAVYYLRRIMHDWPDEMCQKLLKHQADVMGADSKILVADTVVPDAVQKEDLYPYWMDVTMLTFGGKERSAADWTSLFDSAGLELVKIWKPAMGCHSVCEGRLKQK